MYEENRRAAGRSALELPWRLAVMIASIDVNTSIVYKRNPGLLGKDLPFNRGRQTQPLDSTNPRGNTVGDEKSAFRGVQAGEY